jgi:Ca2+-dependent lipid-binding protein|eukprot:COSAG01_NODE_2102_length_8419_cov_42.585216_3_plen_70_part_00
MNAAAASPAGDPDAPVEVHIHVHEAAQLYAADSNSTSDSFVSVQCFGQSQETRVVRENLNPVCCYRSVA